MFTWTSDESYYDLPHITHLTRPVSNIFLHLCGPFPHLLKITISYLYKCFFWSIHKFCGVTMLISVARNHDDYLHNNNSLGIKATTITIST